MKCSTKPFSLRPPAQRLLRYYVAPPTMGSENKVNNEPFYLRY